MNDHRLLYAVLRDDGWRTHDDTDGASVEWRKDDLYLCVGFTDTDVDVVAGRGFSQLRVTHAHVVGALWQLTRNHDSLSVQEAVVGILDAYLNK
jgi:hypothetical protein